jgi:hypothetical protein
MLSREKLDTVLRKKLADEYGIMCNDDLARAIVGMKKANLAILLVPFGKETNDRKIEIGDNSGSGARRGGSGDHSGVRRKRAGGIDAGTPGTYIRDDPDGGAGDIYPGDSRVMENDSIPAGDFQFG